MRFIRALVCLAAITCTGAAANATPVTWVDSIDFNPDRFITSGSSVSYTHDITDNGFTPLVDSIFDYSLSVDLFDDVDRSLEVALVDVAGLVGDRVFFELSGNEFGGWSLAGYTQLALTGLYDVTVSSISGDFFLGGSTLVVRGDQRQSVPEPGTVGLLVLGLLAAVWASRKTLRRGQDFPNTAAQAL